jgi:cytochrome c peroxidase
MKTSMFFRSFPFATLLVLGILFGVTGCKEATPSAPPGNNQPPDDPKDKPEDPKETDGITYQLGIIPTELPSMKIPESNPQTAAKIELGRHLFYDKRMSTTRQVSCGTCHVPSTGFADNNTISPGISNRLGNLNAMTLVNLGHYENYGWNGRFKSLEDHAPGPIFNSVELGFGKDPNVVEYYGDPDSDTLILFRNLEEVPKYTIMFKEAFGDPAISIERIAQAIASFERTFVSITSPFDEFNKGSKTALDASAIRGYNLFTNENKTNCLSCHNGANFTDNQFHSNGISKTTKNLGRADRTGNSVDIGKFRTASLRNAAVSFPYMHDGSIATLKDVIERYRKGGDGRANQDPRIRPLDLTDAEVDDIIAFIKSLTDTKFLQNPALQNPWHN